MDDDVGAGRVKGRNLARWIMLEVHGVEIPRKPMRRSSHSTNQPMLLLED